MPQFPAYPDIDTIDGTESELLLKNGATVKSTKAKMLIYINGNAQLTISQINNLANTLANYITSNQLNTALGSYLNLTTGGTLANNKTLVVGRDASAPGEVVSYSQLQTLLTNLIINISQVTNLQTTLDNMRKATSGANNKLAVRLVSLSNVPGNYYNGANNDGQGATLTATGNGFLFVDGVAPNPGDSIFLPAQSNAIYNGLWTVTQNGSGVPYILTRRTDFDLVEKIKYGQLIEVLEGSAANAGSIWYMNAYGNIGVGIINITFLPWPTSWINVSPSQVAGLQNYLGGGVLSINSNTTLTYPLPNLIYANTTNGNIVITLPRFTSNTVKLGQTISIVNTGSSNANSVSVNNSAGVALTGSINYGVMANLAVLIIGSSAALDSVTQDNYVSEGLVTKKIYEYVDITSSTYTVTAADLGKKFRCTVTCAITVAAIYRGFNFEAFTVAGTGNQITLVVGSGLAAINSADSARKSRVQYSKFGYEQDTATTGLVAGDLTQ